MTRDSEATRNVTVNAIEFESTTRLLLFTGAFVYGFALYSPFVRIYIRSQTLLPSIDGKENGIGAAIYASSSSIEDIFSDVYDITPEASWPQTLRLLSQNSLTEVKVVSPCNIGPWGRLCDEICGECSTVLCNLGYPANDERMCWYLIAIPIYSQVRLSLVIRSTPVQCKVSRFCRA